MGKNLLGLEIWILQPQNIYIESSVYVCPVSNIMLGQSKITYIRCRSLYLWCLEESKQFE